MKGVNQSNQATEVKQVNMGIKENSEIGEIAVGNLVRLDFYHLTFFSKDDILKW